MTWDDRYRAGDHADLAPMPFLVDLSKRLAPASLLDLACGAGRHALLFERAGWQVTAVDRSTVALDLLRARGFKGVAIAVDLEDEAESVLQGGWDLVLCTCYLQRSLFPAIRAAVKPGGRAAFAISLADSRPGVKPMNPDFLLEPGELEAAFAGWRVEHSVQRWPDPPSRGIAEFAGVR